MTNNETKETKEEEKIVIINPGCSNKCVFCFNNPEDRRSGEELRKQELKIAKDLIEYIKDCCANLTISGNDPLEYTKLIPMVRHMKKIGFSHIMLCTHGRVQENDTIMEELVGAGITSFRIPIYGSNSEMHDSVTRSRGSFEETIRGIKSIKNIKKQAGLNLLTAVVNQNKNDILNILKLALSFKLDTFQFDMPYLYPSVKDLSYHVPYRDLGRYLKRVMEYISENNVTNVQFNDIPSCVFGFDNKLVVMPKHFKELKKWKIKPKICKDCIVSSKCNGFYANDITKYGIGDIKPITSVKNNAVKYGSVIIIPGCSNKCVFCAAEPVYSEETIKTNEDKICKSLLYFKKTGVNNINISGNDPIEYSKIAQLVRHIKKLGFWDITIATHARNLSAYNFAKEIIEAGANSFTIPLYGSNEKIHESVTMSRGSFRETLRAIGNLKSLGAKVYISSMILNENKEDLIGLVKFFDTLGVDGCSITVSYITKKSCPSHIPIKEMGAYVRPLYLYSVENKADVSFIDFPYCVIGLIDDRIINTTKPYNQGYYQPLKSRRVKINLPIYREKTKLDMCKDCKANHICDGFYANDIKQFGVGDLKPLI